MPKNITYTIYVKKHVVFFNKCGMIIEMINLLLFISLLYANEPLKVAIIDAGFVSKELENQKPCDNQIYRFETSQLSQRQKDHGTSIANIIAKDNEKRNYCVYYMIGITTINATINAIKLAIQKKVKIINYSGGGNEFTWAEYSAVVDFLNTGGIFVVAAGNEKRDLNVICNYYPACYDPRISIVTNIYSYSNRHRRAVVMGRDGREIAFSNGKILKGTSQSTAYFTGELIRKMSREQNGHR